MIASFSDTRRWCKVLAGAAGVTIVVTSACSPAGPDDGGGDTPPASGGTGVVGSGGAAANGDGGTGPEAGGLSAAGGFASTGGAGSGDGSGGLTPGVGGAPPGAGGATSDGGGGTSGSAARIDAFCQDYCAAFVAVEECAPYDTCPAQCPLVWMSYRDRCPGEVDALLKCIEAKPGSLDWSCSEGVVIVSDESCDPLEQPISDCLSP